MSLGLGLGFAGPLYPMRVSFLAEKWKQKCPKWAGNVISVYKNTQINNYKFLQPTKKTPAWRIEPGPTRVPTKIKKHTSPLSHHTLCPKQNK
jgi:hypothetical protein